MMIATTACQPRDNQHQHSCAGCLIPPADMPDGLLSPQTPAPRDPRTSLPAGASSHPPHTYAMMCNNCSAVPSSTAVPCSSRLLLPPSAAAAGCPRRRPCRCRCFCCCGRRRLAQVGAQHVGQHAPPLLDEEGVLLAQVVVLQGGAGRERVGGGVGAGRERGGERGAGRGGGRGGRR